MLDSIDTEYIELTAAQADRMEPALGAWFAEAVRLMVEASERAAAGNIHAALSSLAAVPRVHSMLVESCAELLGPSDPPDQHQASTGLYL